MKYLWIFLCLPFYLVASTKIVIIGDSISLGVLSESCFVDILQKRYLDEGKDILLINRSCVDAKTDVLDEIATQTLKIDQPDYVVICLGVNDAIANTGIEKTRGNYNLGLSQLAYNTKVLVGVITPYTVNSNPGYVFELSYLYQKLITDYNVYLWNFLSADVLKTTTNKIYPNAKGHQMIADNLYNALKDAGIDQIENKFY